MFIDLPAAKRTQFLPSHQNRNTHPIHPSEVRGSVGAILNSILAEMVAAGGRAGWGRSEIMTD